MKRREGDMVELLKVPEDKLMKNDEASASTIEFKLKVDVEWIPEIKFRSVRWREQ